MRKRHTHERLKPASSAGVKGGLWSELYFMTVRRCEGRCVEVCVCVCVCCVETICVRGTEEGEAESE